MSSNHLVDEHIIIGSNFTASHVTFSHTDQAKKSVQIYYNYLT
jgi:hypothetical protein